MSILISVYMSIVAIAGCFATMQGGRAWAIFPIYSVCLNDTMAYFFGVAFGRRKLIGLSPNKSLEGFFGGFISNVCMTILVAKWICESEFWMCAPKRFNVYPFEDYDCGPKHEIYITREI